MIRPCVTGLVPFCCLEAAGLTWVDPEPLQGGSLAVAPSVFTAADTRGSC